MNDRTQALLELTRTMDDATLMQLTNYAQFLLWQRDYSPTLANHAAQAWHISLIDQFKLARISASNDSNGMEVALGVAIADGQPCSSIFAHPPLSGEAIIAYTQALPVDIKSPELCFSIAIRDGAEIASDNLVAFRVRVNGGRLWAQHTNLKRWQSFKVPLPIDPGSVVSIELCTEAIAEHRFTWAAWGEPMIVGMKDKG